MRGRGERIRTSGPCLPKTVLYQAELLPDRNPLLHATNGSLREPRPRLDRRGWEIAQPQLAADRLQPILMPNELFARGAGAGANGLGLLDLAPVVIVGRHDPSLLKQPLQTLDAGPVGGAPDRHGGGDLVGDLIAVGAVGADGATRAAPRPADGVEAFGDAALLVDELAALKRYVGNGRSRIANGSNDKRRRHRVRLPGTAGSALVVEHRLFDDNALRLAVAFDGHGFREEVEDNALGLV